MNEQIRKAANDLLAQIDLYTDCMSNQIDRENLDPYMDVLEAALDEQIGTMKFSVQELRHEVMAFALLMEARLREKDADKAASWKSKSVDDLLVNVASKKLQMEMQNYESGMIREAADLANYCMMIADVAGALEAPELERKADNGGAGWAGLDQVQMS